MESSVVKFQSEVLSKIQKIIDQTLGNLGESRFLIQMLKLSIRGWRDLVTYCQEKQDLLKFLDGKLQDIDGVCLQICNLGKQDLGNNLQIFDKLIKDYLPKCNSMLKDLKNASSFKDLRLDESVQRILENCILFTNSLDRNGIVAWDQQVNELGKDFKKKGFDDLSLWIFKSLKGEVTMSLREYMNNCQVLMCLFDGFPQNGLKDANYSQNLKFALQNVSPHHQFSVNESRKFLNIYLADQNLRKMIFESKSQLKKEIEVRNLQICFQIFSDNQDYKDDEEIQKDLGQVGKIFKLNSQDTDSMYYIGRGSAANNYQLNLKLQNNQISRRHAHISFSPQIGFSLVCTGKQDPISVCLTDQPINLQNESLLLIGQEYQVYFKGKNLQKVEEKNENGEKTIAYKQLSENKKEDQENENTVQRVERELREMQQKIEKPAEQENTINFQQRILEQNRLSQSQKFLNIEYDKITLQAQHQYSEGDDQQRNQQIQAQKKNIVQPEPKQNKKQKYFIGSDETCDVIFRQNDPKLKQLYGEFPAKAIEIFNEDGFWKVKAVQNQVKASSYLARLQLRSQTEVLQGIPSKGLVFNQIEQSLCFTGTYPFYIFQIKEVN